MIHKTATSEDDVISYAKKHLSMHGVVVRITKGTWFLDGVAHEKGSPDLVWWPYGTWYGLPPDAIAIECKGPFGKTSPTQDAFGDAVTEAQHRFVVVSSYAEVDALLESRS